ncbi:MAG: hypothetical protein ACO25B_09985 [Chitinophagaceae bacterium]
MNNRLSMTGLLVLQRVPMTAFRGQYKYQQAKKKGRYNPPAIIRDLAHWQQN